MSLQALAGSTVDIPFLPSVEGLTEADRYAAVVGSRDYEYRYYCTTVPVYDTSARVVPVDLFYVIFIDFLVLGVLRFCFLLLSNVQFLVLANLPPGLATRNS